MEADVPYMISVSNLPKILDAIQRASAPETFHLDFLKDLGFTSSNDRAAVKLLKFLGFLDKSGRPQAVYREFMDSSKAKRVLATQIRIAYDDLFKSDRQANTKSVESLKGWFKTKTGGGDAVAKKMATTLNSLIRYADWSAPAATVQDADAREPLLSEDEGAARKDEKSDARQGAAPGAGAPSGSARQGAFGLVYRFEINLPDTQNVDTYRAIFRALREELM